MQKLFILQYWDGLTSGIYRQEYYLNWDTFQSRVSELLDAGCDVEFETATVNTQ